MDLVIYADFSNPESYLASRRADALAAAGAVDWRDGADIGSPTVLRTPLAGPMLRSGVDADPELADAQRYPSLSWVSQIGGEWLHLFRGAGAR